jgi:hypothetical protein
MYSTTCPPNCCHCANDEEESGYVYNPWQGVNHPNFYNASNDNDYSDE